MDRTGDASVSEVAPRPTVKVALAGDTMLGRKVGERLGSSPGSVVVDDDVIAVAGEADLFVLNLECCISARGRPWPDPEKAFFFRAPPAAADLLAHLGVDCVSLANNHALDFGAEALLDTFDHLRAAEVRWIGAGVDLDAARSPAVFDVRGLRTAFLAFCDHPSDFAAGPDRPGVAYADLRAGEPPDWLSSAIAHLEADAVVVCAHWGPNMTKGPAPYLRSAAVGVRQAGATLVAGHSAHVFHGVDDAILFDLGDFVDDYATDPLLRNDLGLLFIVTLDRNGPVELEAVPLRIDYCFTTLATRDDAAWIRRRFRAACAAFGTEVHDRGDRLCISWARPCDRPGPASAP